jgi:hypothetical protein
VTLKRAGPGAAGRDVHPAVYRANTPRRLDALLVAAGFVPDSATCVATLHRYAGERRLAARLLVGAERLLPEARRSTIVARYRAGRPGA